MTTEGEGGLAKGQTRTQEPGRAASFREAPESSAPEAPRMPSEGPKKSQEPAVRGAEKPAAATPMMAQYLEIKAAHEGCLLFYRMGDFYEMFFEDAVEAAAALDIALTKRGRHEGQEIPMCGVPVHAAEGYLSRLIRQGFKVAICEQVEDPAAARKRGAKAVVRREVIRLVTPGTITEEELLDSRAHNYLAALAEAVGALALAWLDISTGSFQVQELTRGDLAGLLARLLPGELLVSEKLYGEAALRSIMSEGAGAISPLPGARFDSSNARRRLEAAYGLASLEAFGAFTRAEIAAAGALLDYVELTQKGRLPHLAPLSRQAPAAVMEIDAATRRNLELTQTLTGARKGSLLATIDKTLTGAGARLLAARLAAPLRDVTAIDARLDALSYLLEADILRSDLRELLRKIPEMERALSRLSLGRGGPRDLAAIREGLRGAQGLRAVLASQASLPTELARLQDSLAGDEELVDQLEEALAPDLPLLARDGGFIARGYAPDLDELRSLRDESRRLIAGLQADYAKDTGIQALKVRHNNVLGYFIEVSAVQAQKMPTGAESRYIHRQTLASAVRYTTSELAELEQKIVSAADKALAREQELYAELVAAVMASQDRVGEAASALAQLDVAAGLSELARELNWCRPRLHNGPGFEIEEGRHPVVEAALAAAGEPPFVANACCLGEGGRIWLLTGPNMAGKSTFLRQNALIAILAQMGAFVPARSAKIGLVDRCFSRVGAADDLARGRSTFMVEMVETAAILLRATERSLVILDEIGRGTATFDGLSIAWATIEYLHERNGCRALFATHYHELTSLAAKLPALSCHTMRVKDWQDEIVFLHEVAPGAADRSYGIHVAKIAGLPREVIGRAEEILKLLEEGEQASALTRLADDLPLFAAMAEGPKARGATTSAEPSALTARLAEIVPDELTPREALEVLYELKALVKE